MKWLLFDGRCPMQPRLPKLVALRDALRDAFFFPTPPVAATSPLTPAMPPLSNGANGAIVATATPAVASAAASSVAPAGDGRSPSGDSSECGLHGTSVPLNGAAMGTPRSLFDGVGMCLALPSKEGHPMGAPSTVALTDDGGRPIIQLHAPRANEGPVPGAPVWDRCHSATPARLASIIAHRKGPSSAHDSSISNAAASASPSPGQLNQPIKDSKSSGAAALDPVYWPLTSWCSC